MKLNLKSRGLVLRLLKYPDNPKDMGFGNQLEEGDIEEFGFPNKLEDTDDANIPPPRYIIKSDKVPLSFFVRFYENINLEQATEQFKSLAEDISLSNNIDGTFIATTTAETYQSVFGAKVEYIPTSKCTEKGYWKEIEPAKIPTDMEDQVEKLYSNFQFGHDKK
jgi:hypothetical protein